MGSVSGFVAKGFADRECVVGPGSYLTSTDFFEAKGSKTLMGWREPMRSGLSASICRAVAVVDVAAVNMSVRRVPFAPSWITWGRAVFWPPVHPRLRRTTEYLRSTWTT